MSASSWTADKDTWHADYRNLDQIEAALHIADEQSQSLELVSIGHSVEGRNIWAASVRGHGEAAKQRILVTCTQHAREWLSTMACMNALASWLHLAEQSQRPRPTLTVIPVLNPDGYAYSWTHDRLWRKNRRPAPGRQDKTGVDLNRNWGQSWGNPHGANPNPEQNAYHGTHAFSEPETRAVRDFASKHGDVAGMLDVHTYGQWVIYPASCQNPVSWGQAKFATLAQRMANNISQATRTDYVAVSGLDFAYPACGDAADWFAESQKALALTLELRPGPRGGDQSFVQPANLIAPASEDLRVALSTMSAFVQNPIEDPGSLLAQGPPASASSQLAACEVGDSGALGPISVGALCFLGAWRFARQPSAAPLWRR